MRCINITKEDFLTQVYDFVASPEAFHYRGTKPALIDFFAPWCAPCNALSPLLEEIAAEYGEQLIIYKVDTEWDQDIAQALQIRTVPSLLFIPLEGEAKMVQGAISRADLKHHIDQLLLGK